MEEAHEREEARESNFIAELIKRWKCDTKTCKNFDHNCLILPGQKHHALSSNDFITWNKALQKGHATLDLPPLNVRGSPIAVRKSPVAITHQNTAVPFNMAFPQSPYPFMPQYPPGYPYGPPHPPYTPPPVAQPIAPPAPSLTPRKTLRSSPIDLTSDELRNVSAYMDWVIKNNPMEAEVFKETKAILVTAHADLGIVKALTTTDCVELDIPWGLGRRLKRDIGSYLDSIK